MCAKSCGSASGVSGEGEFLHELEERMEVRERVRERFLYFSSFSFFLRLLGSSCLYYKAYSVFITHSTLRMPCQS